MAYTYILYSATLDRYYVGHTELTPELRLKKHLSDHCGYTGKAKDWQIVFIRAFETKEEAYAFERKIKGWKSRAMIESLIKGA